MEVLKIPKIPKKYICKLCDYITISKKDYNKHLLTSKHIKRANGSELEVLEVTNIPEFICKCNKKFITHGGLWKHKNKCNFNSQSILINESKSCSEINNDVNTLTELVLEVVKQNKELINQNQDLTNKIIGSFNEVIKNGTNNTLINNNISNNKTFNLNVFLNEQCKDAMNIMEFVDSIKLQLSDLEKMGRIGYVEGISNIITTNLKALDITQRPIHCTDNKREVLYVKDDNKWEKEADEKIKIRKAIKNVAHKNIKMLQNFKEIHPDCLKSESKYSDQYNKIVIESFGGSGDNEIEKEDKIIKNIAKGVVIEKDSLISLS
jgi:hypothetical protein